MFPLQRPGVLTKWLLALKRDDFFPTYAHRLCSAHFAQGCFWKSIGKRILKDNAVPTVFDFSIRPKKVSKKTSNDRASTAKKVKRSNRSKNREMLVPEIKCEIEEGSIEFDESRETSGAEYSSGSCLASEVKSEPLSDGEGRNSNSDVTITPTTAPDRTSFAGVFVKEEPQSAESEMDIPVTEELNMIEVKGEPVEGTVKLEVVETMVAADSC
ncbi:peroxynitrite isomerase THAP4 isoform X7 [Anabrus simplex]|uniref:peroxynitrite isomerase THAP4 isoform X7 n=1 Tax=Anabrus simplex TaxID=316456 RepID=UPI0035A35D77